MQRRGCSPGPPLTPWIADAALFCASGIGPCKPSRTFPCTRAHPLLAEQAQVILGQPRGWWSLTSSLDSLPVSTSPTVTPSFPATTPPSTHVEPPAWLFQELLTRQLALPLYFVANFEPKRITFPNVHITQHLLDLNLRSVGGHGKRCPSWLCLRIWLVGV